MALFDFLKKKKEPALSPILPKEIYEAGVLELKDVIAPSALKVTPNELNLGEKIARTFFVISYPRTLSSSWFSPIINLDKIFDVAIHIHPIDTERTLRELQKKLAEVQSQIHLREEKGLVRDPKLDTAYQDIEVLRDQLQQSQEKLFDIGLYITIYGDSKDELDRYESEIKTILESKLVYIKPALFQQEAGFKSVLPIAADQLGVHYKLNSSPLSSIFPFTSFDLTSDRGVLYGINRHNSSLVLFDRFTLENYNSVIFAKAGAGKSLRKDEPVLVRKNGKIKLLPIGKVVKEAIREHGLTYIDEDLKGARDPGLEVFSFSPELKGRWSPVTVAARKDAPDTFYRFQTKSGREVTTTGDHNMIVLRDGRVTVTKSAEVGAGDVVPLPRNVSYGDAGERTLNLLELFRGKDGVYVMGAAGLIDRHYNTLHQEKIDSAFDCYLYKYRQGRRVPLAYLEKITAKLRVNLSDYAKDFWITSASGKEKLPALLSLNKELGTLLGYIASEGTVTKTVVIISNTDQEVINSCAQSFRRLGLSYFFIPRAIACSARPFVWLIEALGASGWSKEKRVAPEIFSTPREVKKAYLRAYFEGDGGVERSAITAISKSKNLISGLCYLLYEFGIIARIQKRQKRYQKTGRKRTFWNLSISGQNNLRLFRDNIGFASPRKEEKLSEITEPEENTNVDVIPGLQNLGGELRDLLGSQFHNIWELSELCRSDKSPSQSQLKKLVNILETRVADFENMKETFQSLASLPELETLIRLGENSKELNRKLWRKLGSSWAWIRSRKGSPGLRNVRILAETIAQEHGPTLASLGTKIHESFLDLDANFKTYDLSLGAALRRKTPEGTSYAMLRDAAAFISGTYETLAKNLPRVGEITHTLSLLAESNLFWDPVAAVEKIKNPGEPYVYDLEVGDGVFLAGTAGMFVHNSYLTKLEILRSLMFDTDIIVIDPEREYEYLSEAVGGRYFNISLTSEHHINPFDLPVPASDESPADILRSNIINLVGLFRIMLGGLSPEEDSLIDNAIKETYALKDITAESDFSKIEAPLLSDLELVLAGMEGGEALAQKLFKYTRGSWAGFINRPTNVDINKKFVVFSVRDMEDELKPVAMYIVMHHIWNAVRRELKKRILVIDEAWWMMKSEDTASFLFSLAKRGRKYFLGLTTITQDVGDFLQSPYGIPIITNSSIQILLKQSPASIDLVQKTFNLTDEEKYLLLESSVGEGIFFAGLKHVAIKVIASYTEDQIITSDPAQLLAIKRAKEELEKTAS